MAIYNREDYRTVLPQLEKMVNKSEDSLTKEIDALKDSLTTTAASDILTPKSGITISNFHFTHYGKLAMIYFQAVPNANKTGAWEVANIKDDYCPPFEAGAVTGNYTKEAWITGTGTIYYSGDVTANTSIWVKATYILK